jgi:hypothetical protein
MKAARLSQGVASGGGSISEPKGMPCSLRKAGLMVARAQSSAATPRSRSSRSVRSTAAATSQLWVRLAQHPGRPHPHGIMSSRVMESLLAHARLPCAAVSSMIPGTSLSSISVVGKARSTLTCGPPGSEPWPCSRCVPGSFAPPSFASARQRACATPASNHVSTG